MRCLKKIDIIWDVQDVSEKLISFYNVITRQIFVQMISNLNSMYRNNSKFSMHCLNIFYFSVNGISILEKEKNIKHRILSCFYRCCLNLRWFEQKFFKLLYFEMVSIFLKHCISIRFWDQIYLSILLSTLFFSPNFSYYYYWL